MTLQDAIRMLGAATRVATVSDQDLVTEVATLQQEFVAADPDLPFKAAIIEAAGLNGDLPLRPIAAMLELGRGTVLNDDPEISAVARRWSILRYLGVFARHPRTASLRLDAAALQFIGGNQRRVLSEELGIGFGILAGKAWCRARNPGLGSITAIDVDQALNNGAVAHLRREGRRQPDYLLAYPDPTNAGVMVYELLETKGTVTRANAKKQLGRAVTQLAGLTVNGQRMTGVAVSTVSNTSGFTAMAVDPEEAPVRWAPSEEKLRHWRTAHRRRKLDVAKLDIDADEFFARAVNSGNAALAEYGGQSESAARWLPSREGRVQGRGNSDTVRETSLGKFLGTEYVLDVGNGQRLRVFQGVESHIADGLRGLDAVAVTEAQRLFATAEAKYDASETQESAAVAYTSDGSVLEVAVD